MLDMYSFLHYWLLFLVTNNTIAFNALNDINIQENNPKFYAYLNYHNKTRRIPWCASYIDYHLSSARFSVAARSFLKLPYYKVIPSPGDIVVFWRNKPHGNRGHASFFLNYSDNNQITVLSGNVKNKVTIHTMPLNKVLGYRSYLKDNE